jgi:hypothetical protein
MTTWAEKVAGDFTYKVVPLLTTGLVVSFTAVTLVYTFSFQQPLPQSAAEAISILLGIFAIFFISGYLFLYIKKGTSRSKPSDLEIQFPPPPLPDLNIGPYTIQPPSADYLAPRTAYHHQRPSINQGFRPFPPPNGPIPQGHQSNYYFPGAPEMPTTNSRNLASRTDPGPGPDYTARKVMLPNGYDLAVVEHPLQPATFIPLGMPVSMPPGLRTAATQAENESPLQVNSEYTQTSKGSPQSTSNNTANSTEDTEAVQPQMPMLIKNVATIPPDKTTGKQNHRAKPLFYGKGPVEVPALAQPLRAV